MEKRQRQHTLLFLIWCTAIALWLYGDVLELPFFFDDFVERPYVESLSLAQIWQTAGDLAYFRPLLFTLWKVITFLPGDLSPVAEHALNLFFFIGDALLVGWLAGTVGSASGRRAAGAHFRQRSFLAATLFLFFPFSYQAVPWLGSLSHILSTFLILAAVAGYWQWRQTGRWSTRNGRLWAALSLLCTLLAPFAHENGILTGPLILALHLIFNSTQPTQSTQSTNHQSPITNYQSLTSNLLPWFLPTLIWFPIWLAAPKAVSGAIEIQSGETLLQNTIYFLQGLSYPFTWFGGWLRETAGLNDLLVAGGLSLLGLLIAAVVLRASRNGRRALFAVGWMVLAAVPTILLLRFDYIINGPRLLLLAGVGAVWLWTDVILIAAGVARTAVQENVRPSWIRSFAAAGLLFILLAQNAAFIRERMHIHQILGDVYQDVVETATQANQRGQAALFINLPSWITPGRLSYAVGHEGVQFWPDYAQPHTLISVPVGVPADVVLARNEAIRPQMPYFYGVGGQAPEWPSLAARGAAVFVAHYQPEEISLLPAGILGVAGTAGSFLASFNQGAVFLEAAKAAAAGEGTAVRLTWQVVEPPPESVTVFVHVVDGSGRLLFQADGDPLAGSFPFGQWPAGLTAEEQRYIPIDGEGLQLLIGLYDRNTGERWTAETAGSERVPDDALRLMIAGEG